jgi:hypothetical protein
MGRGLRVCVKCASSRLRRGLLREQFYGPSVEEAVSEDNVVYVQDDEPMREVAED